MVFKIYLKTYYQKKAEERHMPQFLSLILSTYLFTLHNPYSCFVVQPLVVFRNLRVFVLF